MFVVKFITINYFSGGSLNNNSLNLFFENCVLYNYMTYGSDKYTDSSMIDI